MSQQGGRPGGPTGPGPEDDWWGRLYDDASDDTGPAPAADSLEDRFASAAGAVGSDGAPAPSAPDPRGVPGPPVLPGQRRTPPPPRAWWEPEPSTDTPPTSTPPARPGPVLARPATEPPDVPAAPPKPPPTRPGPPHEAPTTRPPMPPAPDQSPGHGAPVPPEQPPGQSPGHGAPVPPEQPPGQAPSPHPPGGGPSPAGSPPASPPGPGPGPATAPPGPATAPTGPAPAPPSGPGRPAAPSSAPEASPTRRTGAEPRRPGDGAAASPGANPSAPDAPTPTLPDPSPPSGPTAAPAYGDWTPAASSDGGPEDASPVSRLGPLPPPLPSRVHVGARPPTYDAEPTALPAADLDDLDALVPDTVLDGARYGACTLRAVSVRGDSARYRGEPRRDALLTARFGAGERALVLVALATGTRTAPGAHLAAAEVCRWIAAAVGRSHERLTADIRAARRADLKAGLHRLTDRSLGKLRAAATEQGLDPGDYAATLRCLLLSGDPGCRTRVFFGVGPGGLFRLRDGEWQDIEPEVADVKGEPVLGFGSAPHETPDGDRLTMDLGIPTPPSPYEPAPGPPREPFRFRTSVARTGDVLLMCGTGFAEPLRGEPELRAHLADRWSAPEPPGLTAYLADTQVRVKGYADDRTAVAVWEA
ncbi:protein phosphatase 2C domain-containing protein [Streptomyces althioticus]|uniref:protein phosphatase 2C domain-containing protein n=1 Tax=Streptomyces althioticus TaxID=83380 RepID=UPI00340C4D0C